MISFIPKEEIIGASSSAISKHEKSIDRLIPEVWPSLTPKFTIPSKATVYTIGSCFARNIEGELLNLGYHVPTLGFKVPKTEALLPGNGILNIYTPSSIYEEIKWARDLYSKNELPTVENSKQLIYKCNENEYIDTLLSSNKSVTLERLIERRNELYQIVKNVFTAECITITLGHIEAWFDKTNNAYMQRAPIGRQFKEEGRFFFKVLSFQESFDFVDKSIQFIREFNKDCKILITTSPVHLERTFTNQDVIIANLHSKSLLRAICGEIYYKYDFVDYFPSFESAILTKSWDIWKEDKRHVTDNFVHKIVKTLTAHFFTSIEDIDKLYYQTTELKKEGKFEEAKEAMQRILDKENKVAKFWELAAQIELALKNPEKAESNILKAISLDKENYKYKSQLMKIYLTLDKLELAQTMLEQLKEENSDHFGNYGLNADILIKQNKIEEAKQILAEGIDVFPNQRLLYVRICNLLLRLNQPKLSLEYASKILKRFPNEENIKKLYSKMKKAQV